MRVLLPTTFALAAAVPAHGRIYSRLATPTRDTTTALDLISEFFNTPVSNLHQVASSMLQAPGQGRDSPSTRRLTNVETSTSSSSSPSYSVFEDEGTGVVELLMELPGVAVQDVHVELVDETWVRIHGVRRSPLASSAATTIAFDQTFKLDDDVDPEGLQVTLSSGILRITASKKEKVIKQLAIRTVAETGEALAAVPDTKQDDAAQLDAENEQSEEVDGMTITEDAVQKNA